MDGLAYAWGGSASGQLGDNSVVSKSTPISVSSAISWKQIACGDSHTIAIDGATGLAYAWGHNSYGQLGDNSLVYKSVPISVSSAISWKQIACGEYFTAAINGANGLVYAWGNNTYGQLGDNSISSKSVPVSVSSTISWKQIDCGEFFTVAINGANGLVYAWGDNTYGQLGDNTIVSKSVPVSVSSAISWKQIACGGYHTVAIDGANGLAYAWGANNSGQLGDNTRTNNFVPVSVSSAISWKQIACGGYHTVAIDGANGLAYAWGYNASGQLGDNSIASKSVPTSVSSAISWKQIACGDYFTLAINGANGLVYAWGANGYGQLGDNSVTNKSVPTSVSSTISWKQIDAGQYHTVAIQLNLISNPICWGHITGATETLKRAMEPDFTGTGSILSSGDGEQIELNKGEFVESDIVYTGVKTVTLTYDKYQVTKDSLAYAWGGNTYGQLGDNSTASISTPISVSSAISWKQIACGDSFIVAIDGVTGLAYAWGDNTYGQLGDNSRSSRSVPTSVSSDTSWKQVACGGGHTVAINGANGLAYAWGYNNNGQLGDNSIVSKSTPISVSSAISWKQVECGYQFTVGINGANGLAYAWGNNGYGGLGDNTITNRSVPTSVSSAISWKKIACGSSFTVGINGANGLAYAWGYNVLGQLGDNTRNHHSVPTSVSSAISWKQVACGVYHTVAINGTNGLAYAWGDNAYGQLGDNGVATSISIPISVSSAISWKHLVCGVYFTAAINGANGLAYAWGRNDSGQLGDNSITNRVAATSVSSAISWNQIDAGYYHTAALMGRKIFNR